MAFTGPQGPEPAPVACAGGSWCCPARPQVMQSSPKSSYAESGAIEPLPVMSASAALKRSQNQQPAPGWRPAETGTEPAHDATPPSATKARTLPSTR
jgi:hypothetical protein